MRTFTGSLGFRLTAASYLVVAVFMSVAGFAVYRISQDSTKKGAEAMVREMADDLQLALAEGRSVAELGDQLLRVKVRKSGSTWIMDRDGNLLYNPDPLFREEYVAKRKNFGNVMVSLQYASPRASGQGRFKEKLADIAQKYEEGFGTYRQFGEDRILAFRSLPARGLLIGVDEPVASANSELERIKKFISYTALASAVLIMAFNLLSIRIIIRPYYREMEVLNESLQQSNRQLEESNAKLAASNRNLTVLYEVGLGMRHSLALRDILQLIVDGAHGVLGVDRIGLFVPDAAAGRLECRAAVGQGVTPLEQIWVPAGEAGGALAAAFQRGESVRVEEGQRLSPGLRLGPAQAAVPFLRSRAFVVVPLVVKGRAVGVIAVDNKARPRPITDEQVNLLGIFANQAAVAVENARLYDQLRQKIQELDARVDQLSILHQIGNSMQRVITRSEALGFIIRGIKEGIGFSEVVLALVDRERDQLQGELGIGVPEDKVRGLRVSLFEKGNLLVQAVNQKRPLGIAHLSRDELLGVVSGPLREGEYRPAGAAAQEGARLAVTAVPLIAREEVVGVVAVGRREPQPHIRRSELELLLLYANTAGLTVERAELYGKLHQSLESLEITDHVSRLLTHRHGLQRCREELGRAGESGRPLAALLLGIDGFREYNERAGTEAGDRALAEIGEMLKAELRPDEVGFRHAGRLLAVLLPGADAGRAEAVAEGLQERVRRHKFLGGGGREEALTLSIGVAAFAPGAVPADAADLFGLPLSRLRRAEAEGGDRVVGA